MSKLYRSLLWSGLVAAGVAACGDDVTVNQPSSVTVAPSGVSIAVGQTVQMTAAVNVGPGVATTVTWSSSDAAKATVSATGLVTGVAAGSVAIQACLTATPGVCGAATVTVGAANVPTISIASITGPGGVPADLAAAAGQLTFNINLERNNNIIQAVELSLTNARGVDSVVSSQAFVAPPAAVAGDTGLKAAVEVISLVVQTQALGSCGPTSCNVAFDNGPNTARVRVRYGAAGAVAGTASNSAQLTLANLEGFVFEIQITEAGNPNNTANDGFGVQWKTGDLIATAKSVERRAGTVVVENIRFTPTGLATKSGPTATWSKGSSVGSGGSRDYETLNCSNPPCAPDIITLFGASVGGSSFPENIVGGTNTYRIDNKRPNPGYLTLTEQGLVVNGSSSPACCSNNWIGKAYNPASGHTSASNSSGLDAGAVSPTDGGVGVGTATYHAGDPALSNDAIVLLPAFTSGAGLTETTSNTALTIVAKVPDKLGNTDLIRLAASLALPVAGVANPLTTIGVDLGDPTLAVDPAGIQDGDILAGLPASFIFSGSDGLAGFASLPMVRRVSRNFFELGQQVDCFLGSYSSSSDTCRSRVDGFSFDIVGGSAQAYYSADAVTLRDQGGNADPASKTVTALYDVTPPVAGSVVMTPQPNGTNGGQQAQVSLSGTDNVDGETAEFWMQFGGGLPGSTSIPPFGVQANMLPLGSNTFGQFGLPLQRTFTGLLTTPVVTSVQATDGTGTPTGGLNQPIIVWGRVTDVAGLQGANFSSNLAIGWVPAGAGLTDRGLSTWTSAAPATWITGDPLNNGGTGGVACPSGAPSSLALRFIATGSTAFAGALNPGFQSSPFTRVDVFFVDGAGELAKRGSAGAPQVSAPGAGLRAFTWTFSFSAAGIASGGPFTVIAVGFASNGDALVSQSGFAPFTTCGS